MSAGNVIVLLADDDIRASPEGINVLVPWSKEAVVIEYQVARLVLVERAIDGLALGLDSCVEVAGTALNVPEMSIVGTKVLACGRDSGNSGQCVVARCV